MLGNAGRRVRLILVAPLAAAGMLMVPAIPARASTAVATGPTPVSADGATLKLQNGSDLPWPICDPDNEKAADPNFTKRVEVESTFAVDPANPNNMVAAWMQGNADLIVVGYSRNGGGSWDYSIPPTVACTGGRPSSSETDPSISFGPPPSGAPPGEPGIVYLTSSIPPASRGTNEVIINTSLDGGQTWGPPTPLATAGGRCNMSNPADGVCPVVDGLTTALADPQRPDYAYAMWVGAKPTADGLVANQYVAHTTDGGDNWTTSKIPWGVGQPERFAADGRILILPPTAAAPNGTLVAVFLSLPPTLGGTPPHVEGPGSLMVSRSVDDPSTPEVDLGVNWTDPEPIEGADPSDPTPTVESAPSAAVAPDGTIYLTWQRTETLVTCSGTTQLSPRASFSLMYAKSTDGGVTWQSAPAGPPIAGPTVKGARPDIQVAPSVAVASDGTVGIAFYDHRRDGNDCVDPLVTDLRLRHSHDGGLNWSEDLLFGAFRKSFAPGGTARGNCDDAIDNDEDGKVNDGCPAVMAAETGAQCDNPIDDAEDIPPDGPDQKVNDGCPTVGGQNEDPSEARGFIGDYQGIAPVGDGFGMSFALSSRCSSTNANCPGAANFFLPRTEAEAQCDNAIDDDGDGKVNNGCPPVGTAETGAQCDNAIDDDVDGKVNDGCSGEPDDIFFSRVRVIPNGYARPKAATPTTIRLVPAYEECAGGNGSHGAPLSAPSCIPPAQTSHHLTVGTPDSNGKVAVSTGQIQLKVVGESPINPGNGDQADVQITTSVTDVRNQSDLSDYTGELRAVLGLRITDRYNTPFLDDPATVMDAPLSFAVPCSATTGPEGGTCNLATTADAVMSDVAREGQRAIWELSQVKVYDGGSDGDADTTGDNTLFAVQGTFAP
jgi:hypothetical protein